MSTDYSLGDVKVSLAPWERFKEYLQSRGMRVTKPRRTLVDHVFARHEHFDADELMDELSSPNAPRRVARATVYRTLNELVDAGLLRRFNLGGRDVYEHDYGYPQHDHLHCQECDQLFEFSSEELNRLRDAVAKEYGFRVKGHRMLIDGVCEKCSKNHRRKKRPVDLI